MERFWYAIAGCVAVMFCSGSARHAAAANDFNKPVEYAPIHVEKLIPEEVSTERLKSGLSVVYFLDYFERNLDAIPNPGESGYQSVKGRPILELDHQFGTDEVFDSGASRGVAMRMTGYLHIAETGDYQFQALSNDGVRVLLGGEIIVDDAEQHSDRLSNIGYAVLDEPGYYPLVIEYFQRKGTAALKLLWKTPGAGDFVPIPQNGYVHLD
ncbi:MAG: hypothetical protein LJE64_02025 [Desulfofustis sp.]|jgi:mannan endo-1,4-beta-mannosidase|nr:hypothetical protein [Desulfofustis sp.]